MRDRMIAVVVGLLAVGALAGGYWLVTNRVTADPAADAGAAIDAYLGAWEDGDTATMAELVAAPVPDGFAEVHGQLRDALSPVSLDVTRSPVELRGSQADVDLAIEVGLPDADTATWTSTLSAQRLEGTWRILWDPTVVHPELREGWSFDLVEEPAGRAGIHAHDGTPLSAPGEIVSVGIEPRRIEDADELLTDLGALLPEARDELTSLLERDDLEPTWFYPLATVRPDRWEPIAADVRALPGIVVRTEEARVGADDGFALHTLGRVGPADEERAAELGVAPGTPVGRYGLEAAFEDRLTGTPAFDVVIRDADGDVRTEVHRYQGDPPEPVRTTLDAEVQRAVENALVGVGDPAAVVVIDAPTGEIRGVASRPLTGYHRALEGRYPPGSTFKVVTATAVLRAGTAPDDLVECPAETVVGGLRLRNAHGVALGETTLRQAFAASCNTTFATLGSRLGDGALADAAATFGFDAGNAVSGLGLPAFGASFPTPGDLAERGAAAIGQARVEVSPLHLATVAATVASGRWRAPTLVLDGDGGRAGDTDPAGSGPGVADDLAAMSSSVADDLATMMRSVVTDGTGAAAAVPGDPPVAGKTGSAEFGSGDPKPTHAWFIGFRGDTAFAVLVEGGGEGGEVAAPIAARLLRELDALAPE